MKIPNKVVSMICAASMVMAVSVPAFAAEVRGTPAGSSGHGSVTSCSVTYCLDPSYIPETVRDTTQDDPSQLGRMIEGEKGRCTMAYNPGSGDTGEILFVFEAVTSSMSFSIECNRAEDPFTYHYRLYRINGDGLQDTPIGLAQESSFGAVVGYNDLIVGATYYVMGSSMNVPKSGANADYHFYFNE